MIKEGQEAASKVGIIITAAVLVIGVIIAVAVIGSQPPKTTEEKVVEKTQEIVNKLESRSDEEKQSEQATIKAIEAVIEAQLAGNNNQGKPYEQWYMVDRRYTEEEEYFATIRFNADEYPAGEKEQAKKKIAEILKALYASNNKIAYSIVEAYTSQDMAFPIYAVRLEQEQSDGVDWSQSVDELYQDILPAVWSVTRGG
ncbi:MAG: hypothetical protein V1668_01545 [Patescibacteria group bacterium]